MKAKPKKRANRPNRIEFSDEKLETIRGLGYIHCTLREAAAVLGLDESVVLQWHAQFPNHPFTRKFEEGKAAGKISLRRRQVHMTEEGNTAMAIFLGKNWLEQGDIPQQVFNVNATANADGGQVVMMTAEQKKKVDDMGAYIRREAFARSVEYDGNGSSAN